MVDESLQHEARALGDSPHQGGEYTGGCTRLIGAPGEALT